MSEFVDKHIRKVKAAYRAVGLTMKTNKMEKPSKEVIEGLRQEQLISAAPKMFEVLNKLNRQGGLGYGNHEMIKNAIDAATLKL